MPDERIAVRMYRDILGDCFLLTHEFEGDIYRALIDCGVLQCIGASGSKPETAKGRDQIRAVVENLRDTTGGELDLVIATHEHYDHLSGFMIANDIFRTFKIKALWTAWTEDFTDPLANDIRAKRSKGLETLNALIAPGTRGEPSARVPMVPLRDSEKERWAAETRAERLASIADLLQFYGEIEAVDSRDLAASGPKPKKPYDPARTPLSCENALLWLAHTVGDANIKRLEPGMQVKFGVKERLVANVLGPPRLREHLKQLDPTEGEHSEVYLVGRDQVASLSTTLALQAGDKGLDLSPEATPFAKAFGRKVNPNATDALSRLYFDEGSEERRIDGEWLGTAEALALKIDKDVNNTSLALAIEIPSGDNFLFAADAQVGNWLSWHAQKYPAKPAGPNDPQKSAADLLARTILYKVGHHGSHNATLRAQGLELMTHSQLVAMIPVVEEVAREQKTRHTPLGWAMPWDNLNDRLIVKTGGRIVRGDGVPDAEGAAFAGSRFTLDYGPDPARPLWVELSCPGN